MPPLRRLTLLLALLLAAAPAGASAQEVVPTDGIAVLEPPARSAIARGAAVGVRVRPEQPVHGVRIRVAAGPDTDAFDQLTRVIVQEEEAAAAGSDWIARIGGRDSWARRPGPYWWQAIATVVGADGRVVEYVAPPRRLTVSLPAAATRRARLYERFGRRGRAALAVSTAGRPAGVAKRRWRRLVTRSARRWGLRVTGSTSRPVARGDGRNSVGFGAGVPARALAFQRDVYAFGRRIDRDIVIRDDLPWQAGPGHPSIDEYDLESVLVHELGHLAGNHAHRSRCSNHPMSEALGSGEWWRGPRDFWRFGCAAAAARTGWPPAGGLAAPPAFD